MQLDLIKPLHMLLLNNNPKPALYLVFSFYVLLWKYNYPHLLIR